EGYRYTKSEGAQTISWDNPPFTILAPRTREIWIAADGSGRIREQPGEPIFLSEADRQAWREAGEPQLSEPVDQDFEPGGYPITDPPSADPIFLRGVVLARAIQADAPLNAEMFVIVGDMLRETAADPELRAGLYRVAATIDGIELLGETRDRAGRPGVAVGMTADYSGLKERNELIFDPGSSALLGEVRVVVEQWGNIPAGTVVGYNTYLESKVVPELP
ncbi:MAG: hypothetical protein H0X16_12120, partial [Chloroflexi bacterium]|nr:hypothetical protein [Chloroflexota bacterium]